MKMVSHSQKWSIISLLTADIVIFGAWNPQSAPSVMLIVGFLLLTTNVYVLALAMLKMTGWYGLPLGKQRRRLARIMAGVFGGLVALQSIGELSPRDVVVLLPIVVLMYLYVSYQRGEKAARATVS